MDNAEVYAIVQLGIIGGAVALLIVGGAISGPFIARYWYKARRAEMELSLKQSMIERGMTAQQICAVIEAGEERKPPEPPRIRELPNDWKEWANDWKDWAHRWKGHKSKA
jgi:hypothetical protein